MKKVILRKGYLKKVKSLIDTEFIKVISRIEAGCFKRYLQQHSF